MPIIKSLLEHVRQAAFFNKANLVQRACNLKKKCKTEGDILKVVSEGEKYLSS